MKQRLDEALSAPSFEALYEKLDLEYVVDGTGSLSSLPKRSFDCAFSFHVLEHVQHVDQMIREMFDVLKPGGVSIHQIGIDDHLTHYDRRESPKSYIQYSNRTWKLCFENDVQYHNRLQASDFLELFEASGFELEAEKPRLVDASRLPSVHPSFQRYPMEDLRCTVLTIVHRKPASATTVSRQRAAPGAAS